MKKPTGAQVLAAKIRHEAEKFVEEHRVKCRGGWSVPSNKEIYAHLEETFGIPAHEVSRYLTYARYCTHPWTRACPECPVP